MSARLCKGQSLHPKKSFVSKWEFQTKERLLRWFFLWTQRLNKRWLLLRKVFGKHFMNVQPFDIFININNKNDGSKLILQRSALLCELIQSGDQLMACVSDDEEEESRNNCFYSFYANNDSRRDVAHANSMIALIFIFTSIASRISFMVGVSKRFHVNTNIVAS